jgi:hypothetical protein
MTDPTSGPRSIFLGMKLAAGPTVMTTPSGSSMFTFRVGSHEPSALFSKASHGNCFDSGPGPSVGADPGSAIARDAISKAAAGRYRRKLIHQPPKVSLVDHLLCLRNPLGDLANSCATFSSTSRVSELRCCSPRSSLRIRPCPDQAPAASKRERSWSYLASIVRCRFSQSPS